jgi:hypothetical protein
MGPSVPLGYTRRRSGGLFSDATQCPRHGRIGWRARRWSWSPAPGLSLYGVVHLLVGWLAVQIAWSASGSKSADTSGALQTLADQPFGKILLWLVAVGLVALALWQASEALWGYRNREGFKRVRKQVTSGAMAAIYAALGVSAASVALGSGSSSSQSQEQATSGVLAWPGSSGELLSASVSCPEPRERRLRRASRIFTCLSPVW